LRNAIVALDSGVLILAAKGDASARALLTRLRQEDALLVIPAPVLAEVLRDPSRDAGLHRLINDVDELAPTTAAVARAAGERLGATGLPPSCTVDAMIVATAMARRAAFIATTDPGDITALSGADLNVIGV